LTGPDGLATAIHTASSPETGLDDDRDNTRQAGHRPSLPIKADLSRGALSASIRVNRRLNCFPR
jgi:hypothetical protein